MGKKKHIWEGSVGISIEPMAKKDGTYFWKYEFTRAVKKEDGKFDYYQNFSDRNDEALKTVMERGASFRKENDPNEWAQQMDSDAPATQSVEDQEQASQPAA